MNGPMAPFVPFHLRPERAAVNRGGMALAHLVTPWGNPSPGKGATVLGPGTLWIDTSLLGPGFASRPGYAGLLFASARLQTSAGALQVVGGNLELDAGATLTLTLTSLAPPAAAAPPGQAVGRDFLDAALTLCAGATVTLAPGGASITLGGATQATIHGQAVTLTPTGDPARSLTRLGTTFALVPCVPAAVAFTASASASQELALAGTADVLDAGVVFPIAEGVAPNDLVDPTDAWGALLELGPGLDATVGLLGGTAATENVLACLTPARLDLAARLGSRRRTVRFDLWKGSGAPPTLIVELPPQHVLGCTETAQVERFRADGATVDPRVDRPVGADGARPDLRTADTVVARTRTATTDAVSITVVGMPAARTRGALVAENALIPVSGPRSFNLTGIVDGHTVRGELTIEFGADGLIPTLPDPYVSAPAHARPPAEHVMARVRWDATGEPDLSLRLPRAEAVDGGTRADGHNALDQLGGVDPNRGDRGIRLLDLSTNADLWGVALGGGLREHVPALAFDGLRLVANAGEVASFTVPGISWEPIVDTNVEPPDWLTAYAPDDGTPTTFVVASAAPVPLVPAELLERYRDAAGRRPTAAWFTLPFGIRAALRDAATRPEVRVPALVHPVSYVIPTVDFPQAGLRGVRALSIRSRFGHLPGWASVGWDDDNNSYGSIVLGNTSQPGAEDQVDPVLKKPEKPVPASFWDQEFKLGGTKGYIPIARIDLAGHGTSLFSTWSEEDPNAVGVVRADFDMLLGRTGHELVQFQTWILPWCVRLQRTVVFDRNGGGDVLRHDSGWRAVGDGDFILLDDKPTGPVRRVTNIRNVVFDLPDLPATVTSKISFAGVRFDAEVVIDPAFDVAAGGVPHGATPTGTAIAGYAPTTVGFSPTSAAILTMMRRYRETTRSSRLTGALGATVTRKVTAPAPGGENFTMQVSSCGVALSGAQVQTALFGTPLLSNQGQWSVSRRARADAQPGSPDAEHPVPLTRNYKGTLPIDWRLLDPEDAEHAHDPEHVYGLMQGAGTSKTLFEHPAIPDANTVTFEHTPKLADVGALLGAAGVFPGLSSALDLGAAFTGLPLAAGGFQQHHEWPIAEPDRTLLCLGIAHIVLSYKDAGGAPAKGTLDFGPGSWSLRIGDLTFHAVVDGYGPIISVTGSFAAGSDRAPGVEGPGGAPVPTIAFGGALEPIMSVFEKLQDVAAALGGEVLLDIGFSGNKLTVHQGFTLPELPLGLGSIRDIGVDLGLAATLPSDLGFHLGIGSHEQPFHWVVSPLAGTGAIVLGVKGGDVDVYVEAGIGVGLELSVAVASGGASIVLSMSVEANGHEVDLGVTLTGEAHLDVLGGLASASVTMSAAVHLAIDLVRELADVTADVAVGIHVHIAFVVSCDFEGSWAYTEQLDLAAI